MRIKYWLGILLCPAALLTVASLHAQTAGNGKLAIGWQLPEHTKALQWKPFVIPALLFSYGVGAIDNHPLLRVNAEFKDELYAESPHAPIHLDNYLQFAPGATVFVLDGLGIKGRHKMPEKAALFLISNIIMGATVYSAKSISHELRPDGSAYTSFPSGHTAEAFAGAEFLWQEYKDVSPWYGIAGYTVAAATGYLRMYNNKHWFSDVVAGAGVGIASTKLAYWLYPVVRHAFFSIKPAHAFILP